MINLKDNSILQPRQLLYGANSSKNILRIPSLRIAIVCSERSKKKYKFLNLDFLNKARFEHKFFINNSKISLDFKKSKILAKNFLKFKPDWIIAIGGGSIIDLTKIAWAIYEKPNLDKNLLHRPFYIKNLRKKSKLVIIPTLPGSGSEASSSAIINLEKNKVPIVSHEFLADLVILDPLLLNRVNKNLFHNSCLDALTHCIEGYLSISGNSFTNTLAKQSFETLISIFLKSKNEFDVKILEMAQIACYQAGIVQNVNLTGTIHAIAHRFTNIPHSKLTAFFLPIILKSYIKKDKNIKKKIDMFVKNCFVDTEEFLLFYNTKFKDELDDTKKKLKKILTNSNTNLIIKDIQKDMLYNYSPIKLSTANLKKIFYLI
jgi:alcohol dehydrogenase